MSSFSFALSEPVQDYVRAHGNMTDAILQDLIAETQAETEGAAIMQICPEQGAFMTLLTKLSGAKRAVEVGTFTGYSALCVARGLPADGTLLCCDVSEHWTAIGRKYWERAGVGDKITLKIAPAIETLRALPAGAQFDLAFIDADKGTYLQYYEEIVSRMNPGGLILLDNVLWMGWVADPTMDDDDTEAIREVNAFIAADTRVEVVMLPIGDGLTLARKK